MSEAFNLDRETNIENNIDATGKKWVIHTERGRHLFFVRPDPDRSDAVIPELLEGKWTKRMYLQDAINTYIKRSWEHADSIAQKNERKAQAAKEQDRARKQEAKETKASKESAADDANVGKSSGNDDKESKR